VNNIDPELSREGEGDDTNGGLGKITELDSDPSSNEVENECFSDPTLKSISALGDVLSRIHKRMKREGYSMQYGKIVKNENT
jgi:hypothetical protein